MDGALVLVKSAALAILGLGLVVGVAVVFWIRWLVRTLFGLGTH